MHRFSAQLRHELQVEICDAIIRALALEVHGISVLHRNGAAVGEVAVSPGAVGCNGELVAVISNKYHDATVIVGVFCG